MLLLLPLRIWGHESSQRQCNYPEITNVVSGKVGFEWRSVCSIIPFSTIKSQKILLKNVC